MESMNERPSNLRGYTLIELIMVVALLGTAASLLIPQLLGLGRFETSSAVRRLMADLTFAQSEALAAQSYHRIHFFEDGRGYCLVRVADVDFNTPFDPMTADYVSDPSGTVRGGGRFVVDYLADPRFGSVSMSEVDLSDGSRAITFDALGGTVEAPGTPAGQGKIVVTGEDAQFEIMIAPVTGKLSVLRVDG